MPCRDGAGPRGRVLLAGAWGPALRLAALVVACGPLACTAGTVRSAGLRPVEDAVKPPPGYWPPVPPDDLDGVVTRGRVIARLDRAVAWALAAVDARAARAGEAPVLPVATLDRTMRVAEVRIVRFERPPAGPDDLAHASVHATVGIVVPSRRLLQVELVGKPVEPDSPVGVATGAILAASGALAKRSADAFRFHAVLERVPTDRNRFGYLDQVRVHALSSARAGIDYDLLVRPPERGAPATVATVAEAARFDEELRQVDVPAPFPTPSAVARAEAMLEAGGGSVTITCSEGAAYRAVMGREGVEVTRLAGPKAPAALP